MMDIRKLRLKSILPPSPRRAPGPSSSGYNILDQFINQILPMVQSQGLSPQGLMKREGQREERLADQAFNMSRMRPALPQIAQSMQEPEQEMRTVMQALSPYQEASLAQRDKEFQARDLLAKDKQTEVERKNQATEEEKKKRLELLVEKEAKNDLSESDAVELKFLKDMERLRSGQRFTTGRDEILQKGRETIVDKQAENASKLVDKRGALEKEYIALRNDNSKAAMERKAEIDKEIAAEKPLVPSQEKTNVQLKYNKLINEKPEYRDFVSINPDTGLVEVLPIGETKAWARDTVGPTKEQREEILKYLGMTGDEKKVAKKPDPAGIR